MQITDKRHHIFDYKPPSPPQPSYQSPPGSTNRFSLPSKYTGESMEAVQRSSLPQQKQGVESGRTQDVNRGKEYTYKVDGQERREENVRPQCSFEDCLQAVNMERQNKGNYVLDVDDPIVRKRLESLARAQKKQQVSVWNWNVSSQIELPPKRVPIFHFDPNAVTDTPRQGIPEQKWVRQSIKKRKNIFDAQRPQEPTQISQAATSQLQKRSQSFQEEQTQNERSIRETRQYLGQLANDTAIFPNCDHLDTVKQTDSLMQQTTRKQSFVQPSQMYKRPLERRNLAVKKLMFFKCFN